MENTNTGIFLLIKRTFVSVGIALAVSLVLLLCCTGAALSTEDPSRLLIPLSAVSLAVASIVCGVAASRQNSDGLLPDILSGLIGGAVFVLVMFLMTALPIDCVAEFNTSRRLVTYGAVVALSGVGAFVGKKRVKHRNTRIRSPRASQKKRRYR